MRTAEWTYEVAPAGGSAEGLDEYVVETESGDRLGKVTTLLRYDEELFLAVERGHPPLHHDVVAIPWPDVAGVEQERLTVRVADASLERAVALDPKRGVEDGGAEAQRVTELPSGVLHRVRPGGETGPADEPTYAAALIVGGIGLYTLLAAIIAIGHSDVPWRFALVAVPAVLLAVAGALLYRAWRQPYGRRAGG